MARALPRNTICQRRRCRSHGQPPDPASRLTASSREAAMHLTVTRRDERRYETTRLRA